jgi:hypothetical protein
VFPGKFLGLLLCLRSLSAYGLNRSLFVVLVILSIKHVVSVVWVVEWCLYDVEFNC